MSFVVRTLSGQLVATARTEAGALREACWRDGSFSVERRVSDSELRYGAPWPSKKIAEFRKLYNSDALLFDLEEHFNTSIMALCKRAREMGLPKRNPYLTRTALSEGAGSFWIWTNDKLEAAIEEGLSRQEICERLGRSEHSINLQLRQRGFPTLRDIDEQACNWLCEQGVDRLSALEWLGYDDLAQALGVFRRKQQGRYERAVQRNHAREEMHKQITYFLDLGMTVENIAMMCGVSKHTVIRWKKVFGLRAHKERNCIMCKQAFRTKTDNRVCNRCRQHRRELQRDVGARIWNPAQG